MRKGKQVLGLLVSVAFLIAATVTPYGFILTGRSLRAIFVLLSALTLWVTEALPMSISTIFMICVSAILGLMSFNEAISNINTNTMLFIIASSGLTLVVASSHFPKIITGVIVRKTANKPRRMIMMVGILVALCSAFMSSLATCTLFNCLIRSMLKETDAKPGESNLGRDLMITIPACAGIGGFMTPAGTPANVLLLDILSKQGISIKFLDWCKIGFPFGLLTVCLFIWILLLIFPPETLPSLHAGSNPEREWDDKDSKSIVIVLLVILGWLLSSWIPSINITMVAILGMTVMFLPGFNLLNWNTFSEGINWDLVLTMGTVSVLMTGLSQSGLTEFISTWLIQRIASLPFFVMLILLSIIICMLRTLIPTTTAVVALLAPMLIEVSGQTGYRIEMLFIILAYWTASAMILVYTEPIYLITYSNKYYKATDLIKVGVLPSLIMAVVIAATIPHLI